MKRLLIFLVGIGLAWLWWSGLLSELADADRLRAWFVGAGPAGPFLFVLVVAVLFPVFLAGPPIWLSSTIWPLPLALLYAEIASVAAGVPLFFLVRYGARQWAQERIPERVRRWEERLERRPLSTMIGLRLFFWINPAVDLFLGISRVTFRDYLLATAIGLVPPTIFQVVIGAKAMEWLSQTPGWVWIALAVGVAAFFGFRAIGRRRRVDSERDAASF